MIVICKHYNYNKQGSFVTGVHSRASAALHFVTPSVNAFLSTLKTGWTSALHHTLPSTSDLLYFLKHGFLKIFTFDLIATLTLIPRLSKKDDHDQPLTITYCIYTVCAKLQLQNCCIPEISLDKQERPAVADKPARRYAKRLHGLRKSSVASLPIDSLPMVSY